MRKNGGELKENVNSRFRVGQTEKREVGTAAVWQYLDGEKRLLKKEGARRVDAGKRRQMAIPR